MQSFILPRIVAIAAVAAIAFASVRCTQVQQFSRDGALSFDDVPENDAAEYDVVDDFPPAVCNATGFVSGPLEVSTRTGNGYPFIDRSGPDLVIVFTTSNPSGLAVRFLDPVTLAPRADVQAPPTAVSAIVGTPRGVTVAGGVMVDSAFVPGIEFVGRDGSVTPRAIPLGAAATAHDVVHAIASTGRGYGVTIHTDNALWLARLSADGQLADANGLTHVVDRMSSSDIETSAVAWDPLANRYVIAYPRGDPFTFYQLMTARVSDTGALEASDTHAIDDAIVAEHAPSIVWNGAGFAALSCLDGMPNGPCDPSLQLLSPDGIAIGLPHPLGGEVAGRPNDSALAIGGGTYGVIWWGTHLQGEPYNNNIHFTTVDTESITQTGPVALPIQAFNAEYPSLVWDGNAFAAAWCETDPMTLANRIFVARLCVP
jgi:hypothetical protein